MKPGLRESWHKFAFSGRKTQICNLIHANLALQIPDLLINLAVAGLPIEKYQVPTNSPNRLSLKQARGTASGMREKISLTKEQNPLGESEVAYSTL